MACSFGAHVGQQNLAADEMRALWRRLDRSGMDWISVWDHLYEAPPAGGTQPHFEAVACLGALAVETERARLGCLVFCVSYRNPGLLAKAATTIDHLSGGRFELGLGAGWHEWEAEAYGYDFPPVGVRLDQLEEATELIGSMLRAPDGEEIPRTDHQGAHFRAVGASCLPTPVGGSLPLWIGGVGEKRTLRLAARRADGWNAAYVDPGEYHRLNGVLDHWCDVEGRDPGAIERSVNLQFAMGADAAGAARAEAGLAAAWGPMLERVRGGLLTGTPEQAAEQLLAYVDAGAQLVNVALRAPFDDEALTAYLDTVVPAVRVELG